MWSPTGPMKCEASGGGAMAGLRRDEREDYNRRRNSSRLRPACSRTESTVPRGMSFPYGTMTRRVRPAGSRRTNARWLPLPRSGASRNPAWRRAEIIARDESDGSRITRRRRRGVLRSEIGTREQAPCRQADQASWRLRDTARRLQPTPHAPSQGRRRRTPRPTPDNATRSADLPSRLRPSDDSVSSYVEYSRPSFWRQGIGRTT